MCELKVMLDSEPVMEDVVYIRVQGEEVRLTNLLGETKKIKARIAEVSLPTQKALLTRL